MSRMIQTFVRRDTYIEANLEIYQSIRSFVFRKGMEIEKRKHFEKCVGFYIEAGFFKKINRDPPNFFEMNFEPRGGQNGYMHYNGLQEYIKEHTKVEALSFEKLEYLFRIYFALLTAILLVNLAHYYAKKTGIRRIRVLLRTKQKPVLLAAFIRKSCAIFNLK